MSPSIENDTSDKNIYKTIYFEKKCLYIMILTVHRGRINKETTCSNLNSNLTVHTYTTIIDSPEKRIYTPTYVSLLKVIYPTSAS